MPKRLSAALVVIAVTVSGCGLFATSPQVETSVDPEATASVTLDQRRNEPPHSSIAEVVEEALPSVVNVRVRSIQQGLFEPQQVEGQGSGVIIDDSGIIVTNNHVVECATAVRIVFTHDRGAVNGRVVGTAPEKDLAVVKVEADDLEAMEIGNSSALKLGDRVVAMGFPLGLVGGPTVTAGIISGSQRRIQPQGGARLEGLLQTDAAINPGNSGGPLVDMAGRLVGINTAAAQAAAAENVGFAIAIDQALPVIKEILNEPRDERAWLGVSIAPVDSATAAGQLGLPEDARGALIVEVFDGSPAADAGLERGHLITRVGDFEVDSDTDLTDALTQLDPGRRVEVEVIDVQTGEEQTIAVELGQRPDCLPQR